MTKRPRQKGQGRKLAAAQPAGWKFQLNPRRQILFATVTAVGLFGGYFAMVTLQPSPVIKSERVAVAKPAKNHRQPWYRTQASPPTMITAPDLPIFPEESTQAIGSAPVRPYEESLPEGVYEPPSNNPVGASKNIAPAATGQTVSRQEEARLPAQPPKPAALNSTPPTSIPAPLKSPPSSVENIKDAPPWRRFAVASSETGTRPMIAVVIDDMGVDRKRSDRIVALNGPLTVSFLTYAEDLKRQTAAARAAGHEILLHIPMEPGSRDVDPGPNVLLRDVEPDELQRRLLWGLDRFTGYVGINNHMGSLFTADRIGMTILMKELKRRRLLFLDSRTTGHTVGASVARRLGVPFIERNIFLDNENTLGAVKARLAETERLARRRGTVVVIGHPRDATLKALMSWLPTLSSRGFALVPLTKILHHAKAAG